MKEIREGIFSAAQRRIYSTQAVFADMEFIVPGVSA